MWKVENQDTRRGGGTTGGGTTGGGTTGGVEDRHADATRSADASGLWGMSDTYGLGAIPIPGSSGRTRRPLRTVAPP